MKDEDTKAELEPRRILVVDDEDMVAEVASMHLKKAGYNVDVYLDSTAALAHFKENHALISLVIIDMIMPKMDGPTLYREMRALSPRVPIVLSSGFSIDGIAQSLLDDGARAFIQKPFRRAALIETIQSALDD